MWCLTWQVQDLPVLMPFFFAKFKLNDAGKALPVDLEEAWGRVKAHSSWYNVSYSGPPLKPRKPWCSLLSWEHALILTCITFFLEKTLDLVYIILSFLCICIGSYLVPYLFHSLCSIYLYGSPSWGPGFSKHTRYTSYCTGAMLGNGLSCWELLEWDVKLCLVNAIKYDFRKNCRWISCYYHTCSIG